MTEPKNSLLINYHINGYASSLNRLVLSKLIILVLGKKFLRRLWNSKICAVFNCAPSKISFTGVPIPPYSFSCTFRLLVKPSSRRHASLLRKNVSCYGLIHYIVYRLKVHACSGS